MASRFSADKLAIDNHSHLRYIAFIRSFTEWRPQMNTPRFSALLGFALFALAAPALADTFDALQIGILLVDADLRVRAINTTASRLTGWSANDALGQLAYTVFQARDDSGAPLASPVERCLQQSASQPPKELRLRPRGGAVPELPVEASARTRPARPAPTMSTSTLAPASARIR